MSRPPFRHVRAEGGSRPPVVLNCVPNAKIPRESAFDEIYVMPNTGDRGLALGAALDS
jgi:predicted NodU family carbamoyl transferase